MKRAALVSIALALAMLVGSSVAWAQNDAKALKREGLAAFERGRFAEAERALSAYRRYKPDDDDTWYPHAVALYKTNDLPGARVLLEGIIRTGKAPDDAYLYLGRLAHHENDFAEAARYYKSFLAKAGDKHPLYASIVDDVRRAGNGSRRGPNTGAIAAYSENLGPRINSAGDDFRPVLSPNYRDRMYFTSSREGVTGGYRDAEGFADLETGSLRSDMFATQQDGGVWTAAQPLNPLLNTPDHETILDFSMGGQVLVFLEGKTSYSGELKVDTFRRDATERNLYAPTWRNAPLDTRQADNDLIFFNDTTVLFASRRDGGEGGYDLYTSTRRAGTWTRPRNLGPEVNSPYDDRAPFLAADGRTLYFSSNRVDASVGGFDIFRAVFDDRRAAWDAPENAGLSVNTAGNELNFRLSASGLEGYYDSDVHRSGEGGRDIYAAYFKERLREQDAAAGAVSFHAVRDAAEREARALASADPYGELPPLNEEADNLIPVSVTLAPLPYGADDNVTTPGNLEKARPVLQFLEQYPGSRVVITAHADDSDPARFRTYFAVKRAERFADYLRGRGIAADRIEVMSVGSLYPLALNEYNGQVSTQGQRLNRRLELRLIPGPQYRLSVEREDPKVPDFLTTDRYQLYRELQDGLIFRVEVAELGQMFDDDTWHAMPAPVVQSDAGSGRYRFAVGAYNTFRSATQMAEEARRKGLANARVVPYLDGRRLGADDVARFAADFAELEAYAARDTPTPE